MGVLIVFIVLSILSPKFANFAKGLSWRHRASENKFPDTLPDEKPSIIWRFFVIIIIFISGYFIIYYNLLGLGDYFVCGNYGNAKCHQQYKADLAKRLKSESTSGKKSSISKVVKTKTSGPSRRNHR